MTICWRVAAAKKKLSRCRPLALTLTLAASNCVDMQEPPVGRLNNESLRNIHRVSSTTTSFVMDWITRQAMKANNDCDKGGKAKTCKKKRQWEEKWKNSSLCRLPVKTLKQCFCFVYAFSTCISFYYFFPFFSFFISVFLLRCNEGVQRVWRGAILHFSIAIVLRFSIK